MLRRYLVYKLTRRIGQKAYIGITGKDLWWRVGRHYRNPESVIGRALRRHGLEEFDVKVLASDLTFNQACRLERYFIAVYSTILPYGYNVAVGGRASQAFSPEERRQNCYNRSLTWSDIYEIRMLGREQTMPVIAKLFGISRHQVNKILNNTRWRDPSYVAAYVKQKDRSGKVIMWQPNLF